jgi:hypothetical protein
VRRREGDRPLDLPLRFEDRQRIWHDVTAHAEAQQRLVSAVVVERIDVPIVLQHDGQIIVAVRARRAERAAAEKIDRFRPEFRHQPADDGGERLDLAAKRPDVLSSPARPTLRLDPGMLDQRLDLVRERRMLPPP